MDEPYDYSKLVAQCEVIRQELAYAVKNNHLDPVSMSEDELKQVGDAISCLSVSCSKIISYMHQMRKTREAVSRM